MVDSCGYSLLLIPVRLLLLLLVSVRLLLLRYHYKLGQNGTTVRPAGNIETLLYPKVAPVICHRGTCCSSLYFRNWAGQKQAQDCKGPNVDACPCIPHASGHPEPSHIVGVVVVEVVVVVVVAVVVVVVV